MSHQGGGAEQYLEPQVEGQERLEQILLGPREPELGEKLDGVLAG
jgi:hypothetical protein